MNADGQAVIGYSIFSGDAFASAGYSVRTGCGGDAALATIHLLKAGEAPYERPDGGGRNRWGDLSQTVADPDGRRIWTLQEYAAASVGGQSRWGTWWGGFAPAEGASRESACIAPSKPPAALIRLGARPARRPAS